MDGCMVPGGLLGDTGTDDPTEEGDCLLIWCCCNVMLGFTSSGAGTVRPPSTCEDSPPLALAAAALIVAWLGLLGMFPRGRWDGIPPGVSHCPVTRNIWIVKIQLQHALLVSNQYLYCICLIRTVKPSLSECLEKSGSKIQSLSTHF